VFDSIQAICSRALLQAEALTHQALQAGLVEQESSSAMAES